MLLRVRKMCEQKMLWCMYMCCEFLWELILLHCFSTDALLRKKTLILRVFSKSFTFLVLDHFEGALEPSFFRLLGGFISFFQLRN